MARDLLITALVALTAATAHAESQPRGLNAEVIDNQFSFGSNRLGAGEIARLPQRVIPANHALRGISFEQSVIGPNASVNNGRPIKAFVTTAGFPDKSPLHVGPVENIQLNGGQRIDFAGQDADVAHAVKLSSQDARVRNSKIVGWRGTGVQLSGPTASGGSGSRQIENCVIEDCHTGVLLTSDLAILDCAILACRDHGIYSGEVPCGNVYIANCHIYGCNGQTAPPVVYDGKAIYNAHANSLRIVNSTIADSHFGYVSGGGNSNTVTIANCLFGRNTKHSIQINPGASHHKILGCTIRVSRGTTDPEFDDVLGIEVAAGAFRTLIKDTSFFLNGYLHNHVPGQGTNSTSTCLRVAAGTTQCLDCEFQDFQHPAGYARGIHIPSKVEGFRADVRVWGFDDEGDTFLDVDVATIKGCDITIRGNHTDSDNFPEVLDEKNVAQYVDIPAGWDDTNKIRFINEATGQVLTLTPGNAY